MIAGVPGCRPDRHLAALARGFRTSHHPPPMPGRRWLYAPAGSFCFRERILDLLLRMAPPPHVDNLQQSVGACQRGRHALTEGRFGGRPQGRLFAPSPEVEVCPRTVPGITSRLWHSVANRGTHHPSLRGSRKECCEAIGLLWRPSCRPPRASSQCLTGSARALGDDEPSSPPAGRLAASPSQAAPPQEAPPPRFEFFASGSTKLLILLDLWGPVPAV